MLDGSGFQTAGAATIKPREAKACKVHAWCDDVPVSAWPA